jgi:2-aminoethylphosphonate-pyruvate transaminase
MDISEGTAAGTASFPVDLVVFDMAGTTVYDGDAVNESLRGALLDVAQCATTRDAVNLVMGLRKPLAIALLLQQSTGHAPADALVNQVHDNFVDRMLNYYATSPLVREVEGAGELFAWLKSHGIKVGIDTGFNRPIAQVIIDRLGWEKNKLIDVSVTADEVPAGRPAPFMIYRCMEKTGVQQIARVVKVGDTPSDLYEGTNAGCGLVVGVTEGSHTADELRSHPHTHLIATVRDLPGCIEQSRALLDSTQPQKQLRLFTPGPLNTSATVKRMMLRDIGAWDNELIELTRGIRESLLKVARLPKEAGYEAVLMQGSGTFGVEAAVGSLVPRGGRLLVASNGAYGERIAGIAHRLGINTTVARSPECEPITPGQLQAALAGQRFEVVAIVHCETTTGVLNPIDALGPLVKKHGARLIVDAMSSFGGIDIDWQAVGCDALISSSNKCIEGVPGFSFTIVKRDWLERAQSQPRSVSLDLVDQWQGFESHGRFRFTPPTHTLRAFSQALLELEYEGGVSAREKRYQANHRALVAGMSLLGFQPAVQAEHQSHFITTFLEPLDRGFDFSRFYSGLRDRGLIIYAGKLTAVKCFRIGNIGQLSKNDITALINAMQEVLKTSGASALETGGTDGNRTSPLEGASSERAPSERAPSERASIEPCAV